MRDEQIKEVMIRSKAYAYLKRAVEAEIPEQFRRINKEQFESVLFGDFYRGTGVKKFASKVYDNPLENLTHTPFITIDGGNLSSRFTAGFGILFRLITCDMHGQYKDVTELVRRIASFDYEDGFGRNEVLELFKKQDVVFIGEVKEDIFTGTKINLGSYMDEILKYRWLKRKPTIISFSKSINSTERATFSGWGDMLAELSEKEYCNKDDKTINPSATLMRIRTKGI